jgi:GcrA cell cycle regulator
MEMTNWAPEHSDALRDHVVRGNMSFSEIARAINAKFNTTYTRNATLGRAKRMRLAVPTRLEARVPLRPNGPRERLAETRLPEFPQPRPVFETAEPVELRCIEIDPRHLSLIELEWGDCRYPYGGDAEGEAITFCGHPRQPGSSYCAPHFNLSRDPDLPSETAASSAWLRIVETA